MSTLAEIEAAADDLTPDEKQQLFLFLAMRLRAPAEANPQVPREFSRETMDRWIEDDETGYRKFLEGSR